MEQVRVRLDSWKQIADYLQKDKRTAQRWHSSQGLPVYKIHDSRFGSVFAYKDEIDAWITHENSDVDECLGIEKSKVAESIFISAERRSEKNINHLIARAKNAIEEFPLDANTYGILALLYLTASHCDIVPSAYARISAQSSMKKSLSYDHTNLYGRTALAWLNLYSNRDYIEILSSLENIAETNKSLAYAQMCMAAIYAIMSDNSNSLYYAKSAWASSPLSPSVSAIYTWILYIQGHYDEVVEQVRTDALVGNDSPLHYLSLTLALAAMNELQTALEVLGKHLLSSSYNLFTHAAMGYLQARIGDVEQAELILSRVSSESMRNRSSYAYSCALICAGLKDQSRTLYWRHRCTNTLWICDLTLEGDRAFSLCNTMNQRLW